MSYREIELVSSHIAEWAPVHGPERQVAVMMSGGVDSSVTAHLLKEAGWDVLGVTMRIPVACDTGKRGCCGADAAYVCAQLKIPHYFMDVTESFNELIIDKFRASYGRGETPNPCVDCNTFLKFRIVWDAVERQFGIKYAATGHYARIRHGDDGARLVRGSDHSKDQSYFLYGIPAERVAGFVLPIGDLAKDEVRKVARKIGLGVADKAESMELCFAGEGDYRDALEGEQANRPGDMVNMAGEKIGEHKGVANYTLGQRRGLGFAGGEPLYVARIDAANNIVALGTRDELCYRSIRAIETNILIDEQMVVGRKLLGKIRSTGKVSDCEVVTAADDSFEVRFCDGVFAPCPGQKIVLYNSSDEVVGGGTIESFVQ
ncbi:MAG: tRNA 2-thiouridine(34) synthase MnmA [Anaerohalosphaera sp.]|nr:tRNA 2-thiouridine(34) synthase MnmA [Anaerohalosphaera sp.]